MDQSEKSRLFSIDDVNELIPRLELIMAEMQRRALELRSCLEQLAGERGCDVAKVDVPDLLRRWPEKRKLIDDLEELVESISVHGGQFNGLELGLVDFPTEIDGRIVLLCWQYGEKEVSHWHSLDGGFAARQVLASARSEIYLQ
jgi:hypothetical protein